MLWCLAMAQSILVNGKSVSQHEVADGDRIQMGLLDIQVRITPAKSSADLDQAKRDFHKTVMEFREKLVHFQREKAVFLYFPSRV